MFSRIFLKLAVIFILGLSFWISLGAKLEAASDNISAIRLYIKETSQGGGVVDLAMLSEAELYQMGLYRDSQGNYYGLSVWSEISKLKDRLDRIEGVK